MSILDRMVAERNRLLAEAKELDKAIALIDKFKITEHTVAVKKEREKITRARKGISPALKECVKDAILKYNRPVSREEILEFLPSKGFTIRDFNSKKLSSYIFPEYKAEGIGNKNGKFWPAGKPRPEASEWQETLKQVKVI